MKLLLCALFNLLIFSANAQKTALLNTDFKSPIIYTDSVTVEQTQRLFPVGINDFDTLYANLDYLNKMMKVRQRSKMKSFELHAGNIVIKVSRVPFSNGDRYIAIATSKQDNIISTMNLSNINKSNKKNSEKIEKIMDYLKSNKSLFTKPYEVQPKIYNVVVITE